VTSRPAVHATPMSLCTCDRRYLHEAIALTAASSGQQRQEPPQDTVRSCAVQSCEGQGSGCCGSLSCQTLHVFQVGSFVHEPMTAFGRTSTWGANPTPALGHPAFSPGRIRFLRPKAREVVVGVLFSDQGRVPWTRTLAGEFLTDQDNILGGMANAPHLVIQISFSRGRWRAIPAGPYRGATTTPCCAPPLTWRRAELPLPGVPGSQLAPRPTTNAHTFRQTPAPG
jgi:hypothetical protein